VLEEPAAPPSAGGSDEATSEGDPFAVAEPTFTPAHSGEGGADAPDSIFAIEEASGVFKRPSSLEAPPDAGGPGGAVEPDLGAPQEQVGLGDLEFGDFKRETLTRDNVKAEAPAQAPVITPPPKPASQPPFGAGPTLDDIDFSTLMDDPDAAKKGAPAAGMGEVFFVDSPSLADDAQGVSGEPAFEKPKADDFSMEEIGLDGLDGLKPAAPAKEQTKDDIFDVDMGAGQDAAMQRPALESIKAGPAAPGIPKEGVRPLDRPAPRRKAGLAGALIVAVVVIVGGAVAAWQMGLLDEFLGKVEEPKQLIKEEKPKVGFDTRQLAAAADYTHRIEIMTRDMQLKPTLKQEYEEELLWELAWFRFLYSDSFQTGAIGKETLEDRYQGYKRIYAGEVFVLKLEAMELGSEGKWKEGLARFDQYLALKGKRMADLLEKKKLTPQVAREDNLLAAWFKVQNGGLEEARDTLKDLVAEKSGELHPTLLLAMADEAESLALEKKQQPERAAALRSLAVDKLKGLTDSFPQNLQTKLMLARLLSRELKFDEAVSLATDCLDRGRETKNVPLQVTAYRDIASYVKLKGDKPALLKLLEEMKANILEKNTGYPEPEDLLLMLCSLYVDDGATEKAIGTLELCKACQTADYYVLLATAYQKRKLYATADQKGKAGLEKYPNDIRLLMLLADLSRETGQMNSAVAYLERVLKTKPDDSGAALALARLFLELQDPSNARRVLLQAEKFGTDTLEIQQLLVQINEAMGDDAGTVAALQRILTVKDDDEVRKKLASYLIRQGNYGDALKHFEILQKRNLITPDLRQAYAKSLKATGRTQEAVDVLKDLLKENPGDLDTARFLSDIYLQKEDFFNARIYLEASRRADSKNPEIHFLIGTCCLKLQDDACALEALLGAVNLAQDKLEYRVEYANLLFRLSRKAEGPQRVSQLTEARKSFDLIIKRYATDVTIPKDQQSADVYFNRGTILFETGHFDEALKDLGEAMARAQSRYDILLAYADTLYKMNRYDQALKYYQEMVDSKFEKAHAYFYMGKIHLFKGQKEQAKEYLLNSIAANSKAFPEAHRHLGDIFREKGLRKKAADHYRTFLDLVGGVGPAAEDVKSALKKL